MQCTVHLNVKANPTHLVPPPSPSPLSLKSSSYPLDSLIKVVDGLSGIVEREKKRGHDARMLLEWVLSKGEVALPKVRPGWLDANVILDTSWGVGH